MTTFKRARSITALALLGAATVAHGSRPLGVPISGTVSAVSGGSITVNGVTYAFAANSPASAEAAQIHPGESVILILTGPASSSSTQVIAIQPGSAPPAAGRR